MARNSAAAGRRFWRMIFDKDAVSKLSTQRKQVGTCLRCVLSNGEHGVL